MRLCKVLPWRADRILIRLQGFFWTKASAFFDFQLVLIVRDELLNFVRHRQELVPLLPLERSAEWQTNHLWSDTRTVLTKELRDRRAESDHHSWLDIFVDERPQESRCTGTVCTN